MKIHSTMLYAGSCTLLALVPALAPRQTPAQTPPPLPIPIRITGKTLLPFDEMKWTPVAGLEGAQQAILWGDPEKGAHRILYRWPAGTKMAEHSHTNGDRGVVLSGALVLTVEGGESRRLPAGSFFSLAGGVKHSTAVQDSEPCLFYIEREGAFDVVPVK